MRTATHRKAERRRNLTTMDTDNQGVKLLLWANLANTAFATGNTNAAIMFSIATAAVAWPILKHGWQNSKASINP